MKKKKKIRLKPRGLVRHNIARQDIGRFFFFISTMKTFIYFEISPIIMITSGEREIKIA